MTIQHIDQWDCHIMFFSKASLLIDFDKQYFYTELHAKHVSAVADKYYLILTVISNRGVVIFQYLCICRDVVLTL